MLSTIVQLLDLLIAGALTVERAIALKSKIEAMRAEGRDPDAAEWAELLDAIEADKAELDRIARGALRE